MTRRARWVLSLFAAAALAGCSSSPPPTPAQRPGTVAAGTATVSIDGGIADTDSNVSCQTIGTTTTVTTGSADAGSSVVLTSDPKLTVKSVSIRNIGGFTGSYHEDLGKPADIELTDRTYELSGVADGFAIDNPSFRKQGEFTITVGC